MEYELEEYPQDDAAANPAPHLPATKPDEFVPYWLSGSAPDRAMAIPEQEYCA